MTELQSVAPIINSTAYLGFDLEAIAAGAADFAEINEANWDEGLLLVCNPLLLVLPTPLLPSKQLPEFGSCFPVLSLVFLKRWSSTSISTLMLLLGRWRTVLWGTMATVSFESLESFEVFVWLSTSDLDYWD